MRNGASSFGSRSAKRHTKSGPPFIAGGPHVLRVTTMTDQEQQLTPEQVRTLRVFNRNEKLTSITLLHKYPKSGTCLFHLQYGREHLQMFVYPNGSTEVRHG